VRLPAGMQGLVGSGLLADGACAVQVRNTKQSGGVSGWEIAHAAVLRRPPIPLSRIVARVPGATRTPRQCGRCPPFKALSTVSVQFLSPRAKTLYTIRNFFVAVDRPGDDTAAASSRIVQTSKPNAALTSRPPPPAHRLSAR
jgi:hypothetical protein